MIVRPSTRIATCLVTLACAFGVASSSIQADQSPAASLDLDSALQWTPVGPFDTGQVTAATGDVTRPGTFYAAWSGAGLWRTTDYGASWTPLFDAPPAGTIDLVTLAGANGSTIVVVPATTTGRSTIYTSSNAGRTWTRAGWQPDGRVTAVAGRGPAIFAAVEVRDAAGDAGGIFRSLDNGATFERVRPDDPGTAIATLFVPRSNSSTTFAVRRTGGSSAAPGGLLLLRSTDDGATWQTGASGLAGLDAPDAKVTIAAAPDAAQIVALVSRPGNTALFRSDDGGATWHALNTRAGTMGDMGVAPRMSLGPNGRVLVVARGLWRSENGGVTFSRFATPPDRGDRFVWHHPSLAGVFLLAGDRGAIVTVNDGASWSTPSSQATTDVARVIADASFPYRICASRTSPPSVSCTAAHRNGTSGPSDWDMLPPGLDGAVLPDPSDADIVYGGSVLQFNRETGQLLDLGPGEPGRRGRAAALGFSADGRTLYAGTEAVWRSTNRGQTWTQISADLTSPESGRITEVAVSAIDPRTLWVALESGTFVYSRDGGSSWISGRVTPATQASAIRSLELSRFDTNSAYAVVTVNGASGPASRLFRTRDNGLTWTDIGAAVPGTPAINAVREDSFRRGLLFAATSSSVFVSFDDGGTWQSLGLNLPATPVRDLIVKDSDVVVATAGRGVWVLRDISLLRQVTADVANADVFLFRPAQTWRFRATPQEPTGEEPVAMLTYLLGQDTFGDVSLEVIETATGDLIRRFSNRAGAGGDAQLPTTAGVHRVAWDLRYEHPEPGVSGRAPGTRVLPGTYQVRLTANGRSIRQAIAIRMDPRVRAAVVDLTAQRDLGRALDKARASLRDLADQASAGTLPTAARASAIPEARERLAVLARVLQQADVRPSPRLEAAIEAAVQHATTLTGTAP